MAVERIVAEQHFWKVVATGCFNDRLCSPSTGNLATDSNVSLAKGIGRSRVNSRMPPTSGFRAKRQWRSKGQTIQRHPVHGARWPAEPPAWQVLRICQTFEDERLRSSWRGLAEYDNSGHPQGASLQWTTECQTALPCMTNDWETDHREASDL